MNAFRNRIEAGQALAGLLTAIANATTRSCWVYRAACATSISAVSQSSSSWPGSKPRFSARK